LAEAYGLHEVPEGKWRMLWHWYVNKKETLLAIESDPVKIAGKAEVGLDHLLPNANADDFPGLLRYIERTLENPEKFFVVAEKLDVLQKGGNLWFQVPLGGGTTARPNDTARAVLFEARNSSRAVVLLPHWNSTPAQYHAFARILARFGVSCLLLTLPYHDERQTAGIGFARELISENLGQTIQSNRQAIVETRAWLSWLHERGYRYLGVVGVSIGSSIASIVAALDSRVRSVVLLLMADDFAEVVWTGSATKHVKSSLEQKFSLDQVRQAWSIISPSTYAARLAQRIDNLLIVSGSLDRVFIPELTKRYIERLTSLGLGPTWVQLGCGHYTLGMLPYSLIALTRSIWHLRGSLR
jgi:esterase/lipase